MKKILVALSMLLLTNASFAQLYANPFGSIVGYDGSGNPVYLAADAFGNVIGVVGNHVINPHTGAFGAFGLVPTVPLNCTTDSVGVKSCVPAGLKCTTDSVGVTNCIPENCTTDSVGVTNCP